MGLSSLWVQELLTASPSRVEEWLITVLNRNSKGDTMKYDCMVLSN